jgi:outer membrane protein assembly factor BamE (lipoprotein component of BamABCDE complex)
MAFPSCALPAHTKINELINAMRRQAASGGACIFCHSIFRAERGCCAPMKAARLLAILAVSCLSGCSTPGSQYARAHPELSPEHREILVTGKVPGGLAVDGMTKEQLRIAVGNPTKVESFNGQDAWVYVQQRFLEVSPRDDPGSQFGSGANSQRNFTETANLGPRPSVTEVTTIFFHGDRATHTQISHER